MSNLLVLPRQLAMASGAFAPNTLYFYEPGTSTPKAVYDVDGDSLGTSVAADANGRYPAIYGDGLYKVVEQTSAGVTVWTADNVAGFETGSGNGSLRADLASTTSGKGASLVGLAQGGSVQDAVKYHTLEMHGGAVENTPVENKVALQDAISAADAAGGGWIIVNPGINYGYNTQDLTTYPDFTGCANDIVVIDHGYGTADGTNKSGAQVRQFVYTAQTTPAGQHDGNGQIVHGAWHPYIAVNNTADLAAVGDPSRTADDNRRASVVWYKDGQSTWRLGQGTLAGAAYTDEELTNFVLEHYQCPGDTLGDYAPLTIERKTGNWSIGGGTNAPQAMVHIKSVSPGYYQVIFESLGPTAYAVLRTGNGEADDVVLQNNGGEFSIQIPGLGAGLSIDGTNRHAKFGGGVSPAHTTKANLPTASGTTGWMYFVTDAAGGASPAYSDGSTWISLLTGSAV